MNHLGHPPRVKSTSAPFRVKTPQMSHELPDVIQDSLRKSAFGFLSEILRSSQKWVKNRFGRVR